MPHLASIPWQDWQFWVVTALALAGGWVVIRPLLPRRGRGPACPGCGPGGGTQERRATLTVDGRRVE
ncbi:MAG: hypothetical protein U0574_06275 [Phycisphaerales bacterium]